MSTNVQLDKTYDPAAVEQDMVALWDESGSFRALPDGRDQRFVVMIPLPNVTGTLHLGHAINNTLQDIVTRWHRMRGFNSLYQPGTDHAGIATQAVVERRIREEEGKSRHDLGREELVRRIWAWKDQYQTRIFKQLKMMGSSCDWERTRFTLDERYSDAVHEAFFNWFDAGLIYRGERLVNWDTHLLTAVADDEVYHKTVRGGFWHFKYPIVDPPSGGMTHLGFATTRPETMLGDVALAVNPDDGRYRHLIGKRVRIPLFDPPREIPIIADGWADPEKGTGCVKITPAHDPNDYEVGLRHGLEMINIMTIDGKVNEHGGRFAGLSFAEARKAVAAEMERLELLDKVEEMDVDLPLSDRSKSPIEPFLSPQWFVRMSDVDGGITLKNGTKATGLAQAAMDAVIDGRVRIIPERYTKTYLDWLSEKRDWCISRQLWWGHQIPIWKADQEVTRQILESSNTDRIIQRLDDFRKKKTVCRTQFPGKIYDAFPAEMGELADRIAGYWCPRPAVAKEFSKFAEQYGFVRDPDVLDTWFSSQLWPFATLGWPEKTADLSYYYPGSVLITSRDIITLWVARMVLSGLYNIGDVPFREVYIHPKILDGRGETMSKSKGNGVDPLDIIDAYGADAMRYSLADMTTETQDVRMPVDYRCPHCRALTPQTAGNMSAKTIRCKQCKETFATRWADDATVDEHGLAGMVSDKFEIGRNFCNKLWNAARFAFLNIEGAPCASLDLASLPTEDRWILARLSETIRQLHEELSQYRFSASIKLVRDYFWDALCDWYIELAKARMADGPFAAEAKQTLAFCLDQTLRMLHPFIPFVTERLWRQLNAVVPARGLVGLAEPAHGALLVTASFPPAEGWPSLENSDIVLLFSVLQEATRGIRDLRNRSNVPPREQVTATINVSADRVDGLREQASILQRMAKVGLLHIATDAPRPANSGVLVLGAMQIYVHDVSDDAAERSRLTKEMASVEKQIAGKEAKLGNNRFVENAKQEVVAAERERLVALQERKALLAESLTLLE